MKYNTSYQVPAVTIRGDLYMGNLLIDALSHEIERITLPKNIGKVI